MRSRLTQIRRLPAALGLDVSAIARTDEGAHVHPG
jgi:hypothetical protein